MSAAATTADIAAGDLDQARREKGWTATRTRVALALFNSGLSAKEVAGELGGVSRNAVIGKVHRSGLSEENRKASRAAGQARAKRRQGSTDVAARRPVGRRSLPPKEAPPPSISDQQIPLEQRRTLTQLDNACCHWPVGDPQSGDFFFCGAPKDNGDGIPYCPSHMVRSRHRDERSAQGHWRRFLNTGPGAPWRAR